MEAPQATTDTPEDENDKKIADLESLVTAEQVYSDIVARRRRKFTKKRNSSLSRREPTPARTLDEKTTTTDEEVADRPPKTPERCRNRRHKSLGNSDTESEQNKKLPNGNNDVKRSHSFEAKFESIRNTFSDAAQEEVLNILNKTKKSISAVAARGRERFKKTQKTQIKRSQSAPHSFTQAELDESLKKANLLNGNLETNRYNTSPKSNHVSHDESDSENLTHSSTTLTRMQIVPKTPALPSLTKHSKNRSQCFEKVIEVLDPNSFKVVARTKVIKPDFRLRELFSILFMFTPLEIYREFQTYKVTMAAEYRNLKRLWSKSMFQLFLIMMFCGVGGIMFKLTEGGFENFYKCGVKKVKRDFIDLLWAKSHNLREDDWKSLARNRLRLFEEEIHAAHEAGMTTYSGQRSWTFLNGVVYTLTVVTTIGYGHLYPTTTTGMALTIIYSLIGIPLFLIALTDFGKLFTRGIKFLWSFVRRLYYTGSCRKVRKTAHVQEIFKGAQLMYDIVSFRRGSQVTRSSVGTLHPNDLNVPGPSIGGDDTPTTPAISNFEIDDEFNLPISLALFILVAYIFVGALGFWAVEDWSFFASFYFVFISMSTIGFGDYVPKNPIATLGSIVYLCFGLALMSMCINVVQVKLSDTFKHASDKIGASIGIDPDGSSILIADHVEIPGVHTTDLGKEGEDGTEEKNAVNNNQLAVPGPGNTS